MHASLSKGCLVHFIGAQAWPAECRCRCRVWSRPGTLPLARAIQASAWRTTCVEAMSRPLRVLLGVRYTSSSTCRFFTGTGTANTARKPNLQAQAVAEQ